MSTVAHGAPEFLVDLHKALVPAQEQLWRESFRAIAQLLESDETTMFPTQAELLGRVNALLVKAGGRFIGRFTSLLPQHLKTVKPVPPENPVSYIFTGQGVPARKWSLELSYFSDLFEAPAANAPAHLFTEDGEPLSKVVRARRIPPGLDGYAKYLRVAQETLKKSTWGDFINDIRKFQDPSQEFVFDDMYEAIAERLSDHPDLILGFGQFVTDDQAIRLNQLADGLTGIARKRAKSKDNKESKDARESKFPRREKEPEREKERVKSDEDSSSSAARRSKKRVLDDSPEDKKAKASRTQKKQIDPDSDNDEDFIEKKKQKRDPEEAGARHFKSTDDDADGNSQKRQRLQRAAADQAVARMRLFDNDFDLTQLKPDQCTRLTPSYILLPENARRFHSSALDDLGADVLNHAMLLSPPKATHRQEEQYMNPHAEVLSMLEQDMMEMDILIERARATLDRVEAICGMVSSPTWSEDDFDLDLVLGRTSAVHRHTIKQVYGRLGLEKIDLLLSSPSAVVPEVIAAINNKLSEYYDYKNKFTQSWRNVPRDHYPLSLNDRGGFFKKKDSASRKPIALLAELKKSKFDKTGHQPSLIPSDKRDFSWEFDTRYHLGPRDTIAYVFDVTAEVCRHLLDPSEYNKVFECIAKVSHVFFRVPREEISLMLSSQALAPEIEGIVASGHRQFFIGNIHFLTIMRLVQIAVDRLESAKNHISFESHKFDWNRIHRPVPTSTTLSYTEVSDKLINTEGAMRESFKMSDEVLRDPSMKVAEHRRLLKSMFSSSTSTDEYEGRVIRLFGLQSYSLFALDELLVELAREFIHIARVAEESLLDVYLQSLKAGTDHGVYVESVRKEISRRSSSGLENIPVAIACDGKDLYLSLVS